MTERDMEQEAREEFESMAVQAMTARVETALGEVVDEWAMARSRMTSAAASMAVAVARIMQTRFDSMDRDTFIALMLHGWDLAVRKRLN